MNKNLLAAAFNWLGDALERFNPSAFRFLAALLPYTTPLPVAWLTSHSASTFLGFEPWVSFVFVFGLEGIGLWFTSLLVDSVVDWIRSRNWKSAFPMIMFGGAVSAYVYILVSLNVTLEAATGNADPQLSKVITLLCFLPLITGIGNGYYKMKVEHKTAEELEIAYKRELEERRHQEDREDKKEKWKLRNSSRSTSGSSTSTFESTSGSRRVSKVTSGSNIGSSKIGRPSIHEGRVFSYMDETISRSGRIPTFTEVARDLNLPQSTASRLRNQYIETHPNILE